MSKRAEELALSVLRESKKYANSCPMSVLTEIADAELRKERERCADKAIGFCQQWAEEPWADTTKAAFRAAILSEDAP